MSNRNNRPKQQSIRVASPTATPEEQAGSATRLVSLRLPGKLQDTARSCAESCGIPLNGLICIALADYLSSRGYKVHPV